MWWRARGFNGVYIHIGGGPGLKGGSARWGAAAHGGGADVADVIERGGGGAQGKGVTGVWPHGCEIVLRG